MAKKNQEWEEIVVKNGDYDGDDSNEEDYPKEYPIEDYPDEDYPKGEYPKEEYPDEEYPKEGYPERDYPNTEDYPKGEYPDWDYPNGDDPKHKGKYLPKKGYPHRGFETPIAYPGYFDGEMYAKVYEYGGYKPTNIIRTDQSWGVHVKWKTSGKLARMICGTWCVRVHLESIGRGPEFSLPAKAKKIPLRPCDAKGYPETVWYKCKIYVPPGLVPAKYCSTPYKLVTTLTYLEPCKYKKHKSPGPIAAYVDGPLLQFFHP